ncbi:MAG TPA: hypothetical protein VKW78_19585 [Terriglobales bacterium]|nr:hypothetical protein [Terriglobales bacterium]
MFAFVSRPVFVSYPSLILFAVLLALQSCTSCKGKGHGGCDLAWYEMQYVSASSAPQNTPANAMTGTPASSTDGRFIAFASLATNLTSPAPAASNQLVYLRDMCTGSSAPSGCQAKTVLVSANSSGQPPSNCFGSPGINSRPGISGDGRYVVFESNGCNLGFGANDGVTWQIYVRDTCTGPNGPGTLSGCTPNTVAITQSHLPSRHPTISSDGMYVSFMSNATDLPNDRQGNPPAGTQIYVADISRCQGPGGIRACLPNIILVSQDSSGNQANSGVNENGNTNSPQISPNGRFVVFTSNNRNLGAGGLGASPTQVFVADACISGGVGIAGCNVQAYGPFSIASGGALASSDAQTPTIDGSGRFLAFASTATNLASNATSGTTQIYFVDDCTVPKAQTGCATSVKLVSTTLDGTPGNQASTAPFMASNGGAVLFQSLATNFVQPGTVPGGSIFVSSTCAGNPSGCVTGAVGFDTSTCGVPNGAISQPVFDLNSDLIVFTSNASNLDPGATSQGVFTGKQGP